MVLITFRKQPSARTGNCIFQYLACKLFSLLHGHIYVPVETFDGEDSFVVTDNNFLEILENKDIKTKNLYCDGFFQFSEPYVNHRSELIALIKDCNDIWYEGSRRVTIAEFLNTQPPFKISSRDIVLSLRLDDFIQLPAPTSDIICPTFYKDILETLFFEKLYIVCDKLRYDWEYKYIEYFKKWSPIMIQGSLISDAAVMREAPRLLHSNSTLCWIMSYLSSEHKQRIIPRTFFYRNQNLDMIEPSDVVLKTSPLSHASVRALDVNRLELYNFLPLPFAIPDKYIVSKLPSKTAWDANIPISPLGTKKLNKFGVGQETEYLETYKNAWTAKTHKRGGWDCLRHYEILASGCIPDFQDISDIPSRTMISFPKQLLMNSLELIKTNLDMRVKIGNELLKYTQENLGTNALARYFLSKFPHKINSVLLLSCNMWPNYSREFLMIGLHNNVEKLVNYPPLNYMFAGNGVDKSKLHGNGYCYTDHIEPQTEIYDDNKIKESINDKVWDLIILGKIGPDEGHGGHYSQCPFWETIIANYDKDKIAFIYGGDEPYCISKNDRYRTHLIEHSKFGRCFVREIDS